MPSFAATWMSWVTLRPSIICIRIAAGGGAIGCGAWVSWPRVSTVIVLSS